jgi:hypothetical protein
MFFFSKQLCFLSPIYLCSQQFYLDPHQHLCTLHTFGKKDFIGWFRNIQMADHADWLVVGDFNLYRSPTD